MSSSLPATMNAVHIRENGGPEVLEKTTRNLPQLKEGEVLIKVAAAGLNRPDIMQRTGLYPPPPGVTDIPGLEVAGRIAALGTGVTNWSVGDKVCALVAGGGYADYCPAPAEQCLPLPASLTMAEGAGLAETFFTVWSNVFDRGRLVAGEIFLIHGGTSGIGTTAIQLAKAFGATVITTSGDDDKCAFCRDLGADLALNYKTEDFEAEIKKFTDGKGVNVILDMVGGDYVDKNLRMLAVEGRLVLIAVQKGPKATLNILPIMLKRLTFTGSTLRARETSFKADIAASLKEKVWPLLENGTVKPIISKTFPLEEAAAAHTYLESGKHKGKVILTLE